MPKQPNPRNPAKPTPNRLVKNNPKQLTNIHEMGLQNKIQFDY